MDQFRAGAAKVALELDKRDPLWFRRMNLRTLNLQTSRNCVMGQIYGSWQIAPEDIKYAPCLHNNGYLSEWYAEVEERREIAKLSKLQQRIRKLYPTIYALDLRRPVKPATPLFIPADWTEEREEVLIG